MEIYHHYFRTHLSLLNRHIQEFGLPPVLGYLLGFACFYGLSYLLFLKTSFAEYLYLLIAFGWLLKLADVRRNTFLRSNYAGSAYYTSSGSLKTGY